MKDTEKKCLIWIYAALDELIQGVLGFNEEEMDKNFKEVVFTELHEIMKHGRNIKKAEVELDNRMMG